MHSTITVFCLCSALPGDVPIPTRGGVGIGTQRGRSTSWGDGEPFKESGEDSDRIGEGQLNRPEPITVLPGPNQLGLRPLPAESVPVTT
ncbi:MAG: hypothetical protein ACI9F9_000168 [Candidatus Paceibacteria bacterium]|jgi:hypothetical protein